MGPCVSQNLFRYITQPSLHSAIRQILDLQPTYHLRWFVSYIHKGSWTCLLPCRPFCLYFLVIPYFCAVTLLFPCSCHPPRLYGHRWYLLSLRRARINVRHNRFCLSLHPRWWLCSSNRYSRHRLSGRPGASLHCCNPDAFRSAISERRLFVSSVMGFNAGAVWIVGNVYLRVKKPNLLLCGDFRPVWVDFFSPGC